MRLKLFYDRSVHENASYYYQKSKEAREKLAGAQAAAEETEREIARAKEKPREEVRVKRKKEWFEKFHNAITVGGRLMIGGRSAQQNDLLVSRHMEDGDLFFHADIQGGAVVVLKDGAGADEQDLLEAAQFAACFSNAWKNGNATVDVYAVSKSQLTKSVSGGFVPAGAFAIVGERRWFRSTALVLRVGLGDKGPEIVPAVSKKPLGRELVIVPSRSGKEKGALAKSLARRFSVHPDELLELLPNGKSHASEPGRAG